MSLFTLSDALYASAAVVLIQSVAAVPSSQPHYRRLVPPNNYQLTTFTSLDYCGAGTQSDNNCHPIPQPINGQLLGCVAGTSYIFCTHLYAEANCDGDRVILSSGGGACSDQDTGPRGGPGASWDHWLPQSYISNNGNIWTKGDPSSDRSAVEENVGC